MYKICEKECLGDRIISLTIHAPYVAKNAKAGQFVIVRANENSERIPLTIADYDRMLGNVTIIFQVVGRGTQDLNNLYPMDYVQDIVGPLGKASEIDEIKKAIVVGGGVGCAIALPILRTLNEQGTETYSVIGFKNKSMVILEEEFADNSEEMILMTDDGSYGREGKVTKGLEVFLDFHKDIDCVYVIGPLKMMKYVCELTKKYGVKTVVSMNPIMVDGTGMCGGCRLTVGGEMKFACIDGPEFDGHLVDFDEMIKRNRLYDLLQEDTSNIDTECCHSRESNCNLFQEVQYAR